MTAQIRPVIAAGPIVMRTTGWPDYALIDSGDGRKLERYGPYRVVRPEPQCLWSPRLDAERLGRRRRESSIPPTRTRPATGVSARARDLAHGLAGCASHGRLTAFRHLAFFPEQAANWAWLKDRLQAAGRRARC